MSILQSDIGFVKKLFLCFEQEKVSYCVLRNSDEIISGDAHDIDMTIDFKCFPLVCKIINDIAGTEWKIHYISEKDNGNLVAVHLYKIDNGMPVLIHFDFFQSFGWNGYNLISNDGLLKNRKKKEWLYEADYAVQAVCMLFSRYLYHGYIKEKYRDFIQQIFENQRSGVENLMCVFLPKDIAKCISDDVLDGDWNNIEQEHSVVTKIIIEYVGKKQKYCRERMLLFHLKRMKKCTGVIVGIGGKDRIQECYSYVKKVQSILSRTFSAEDIVETFGKTGGYRTAAYYKVSNRVNLSKGKLIFTDDLNPAINKVIIEDISKIPPISAATLILDTMSRRYGK